MTIRVTSIEREIECLLRVFAVAALGVSPSMHMGAWQWQRKDAVRGQLFCSNSLVVLGPLYFYLFCFSWASVRKTEAERHQYHDIALVDLLLVNLRRDLGKHVETNQLGDHGSLRIISWEQRQPFMSTLLRDVEVEDPP